MGQAHYRVPVHAGPTHIWKENRNTAKLSLNKFQIWNVSLRTTVAWPRSTAHAFGCLGRERSQSEFFNTSLELPSAFVNSLFVRSLRHSKLVQTANASSWTTVCYLKNPRKSPQVTNTQFEIYMFQYFFLLSECSVSNVTCSTLHVQVPSYGLAPPAPGLKRPKEG